MPASINANMALHVAIHALECKRHMVGVALQITYVTCICCVRIISARALGPAFSDLKTAVACNLNTRFDDCASFKSQARHGCRQTLSIAIQYSRKSNRKSY